MADQRGAVLLRDVIEGILHALQDAADIAQKTWHEVRENPPADWKGERVRIDEAKVELRFAIVDTGDLATRPVEQLLVLMDPKLLEAYPSTQVSSMHLRIVPDPFRVIEQKGPAALE